MGYTGDVKLTETEYDEIIDPTDIPIETGLRYLKIIDAKFDPVNNPSEQYDITVQDLTNQAEFSLRYWLKNVDSNGNITQNRSNTGTMISLGKALFGEKNRGVRMPCDIIGGVVIGDVSLKDSTTSAAKYPRVYRFTPADEETVRAHSSIAQYFE